jgi:hypothetical protein
MAMSQSTAGAHHRQKDSGNNTEKTVLK